jgi:peptidoglycan/xylan/chitin deacetylase (PgdA/CDA1 family)
MDSNDWLEPVRAALDAAPAPVDVFFRDDDAGWGDARLIELLELFAACGLPVDLAVIPGALEPALAGELRDRVSSSGGLVRLHQHGYAHVNHEVEGRKCEFGFSRSGEEQRRDIAAGRERLAELLGDVVDPIFTPPWNRCTPATGYCLADLGFAALSREARAAPLRIAGLRELPVRVDWFAQRHGVRLTADELSGRLAEAFGSGAPAGVMFHHAVMDRVDMRRAGELLRLVAEHPCARPAAMADLLG